MSTVEDDTPPPPSRMPGQRPMTTPDDPAEGPEARRESTWPPLQWSGAKPTLKLGGVPVEDLHLSRAQIQELNQLSKDYREAKRVAKTASVIALASMALSATPYILRVFFGPN